MAKHKATDRDTEGTDAGAEKAPAGSDFGTFGTGTGGTFTASKRLYLTKDNKVVTEDDPERFTLLVNEGGTLPAKRAKELGLGGGKSEAE